MNPAERPATKSGLAKLAILHFQARDVWVFDDVTRRFHAKILVHDPGPGTLSSESIDLFGRQYRQPGHRWVMAVRLDGYVARIDALVSLGARPTLAMAVGCQEPGFELAWVLCERTDRCLASVRGDAIFP